MILLRLISTKNNLSLLYSKKIRMKRRISGLRFLVSRDLLCLSLIRWLSKGNNSLMIDRCFFIFIFVFVSTFPNEMIDHYSNKESKFFAIESDIFSGSVCTKG